MKRKIYKLLSNAKQGLFAFALVAFSSTAYSQVTYTLNYTGSVQTVNLPAGTYTIAMWGADGGDGLRGTGGKGGYTEGTLVVTAATSYYIYVGGKGATASAPTTGGWNGGGSFTGTFSSGYNGGTGGGGTDIRTTSNTTYSNRIVVAGGGGGGTGYSTYTGTGGNGGGPTAGDGTSSRGVTYAGGGGTQVAGGVGATGGINGYSLGGAFGIGGNYAGTLGGTAGGGGYYGGGSGHWGGASGGGSGYIGGVTGGVTVRVSQPGFVPNPDITGNGMAIIGELCGISLTASGSNSLSPSICSGQSVTLTTDGISNYVWSNGNTTTPTIAVTPTITTVYTLSATSPSNCTASKSITVVVTPTTPVLTFTTAPSSGIVCLGQTASLTADGAVSYTLTGGPGNLTNGQTFTPTATSNYTITGENVCGTASVVTTISLSTLSITASASSTVICSGTTATLTASGASAYAWTSGGNTAVTIVNPITNSTYTVTGTDVNNCTATTTIEVNVNALPMVMATTNNTLLCTGQTATLSAAGANTYTWSTTENTMDIAVSPTVQTTYTLVGTDTNGCMNTTTITQDVSLCTGIVKLSGSEAQAVSLYPNPTSGILNVELEILNDNTRIEITNTLGQIMLTESISMKHSAFNIQDFSAGVYFVKVIENNKQHIIKVVKQ